MKVNHNPIVTWEPLPQDFQLEDNPVMNLFLGKWQGDKEGRSGYWLRWWDESGMMLLWAVEQIDLERQRAEQERQRAEQEREQK